MYEARHERRGGSFTLVRLAMLSLAVLLIVGGLAIGWLPGPGGFIAIFGVAIFAQELYPVAWLSDRTELLLRDAWSWFLSLALAAKAGLIAACLALTAGALYVGYQIV
ncbi:MAG: hypothetical protein R3B57_09980 [Phycisphaerales bacterium]